MSVFTYWAARTGFFLAILGVLWWVGWWDLFAFVAALILAWMVSYLALPGMRARAAAQMDTWIHRSEKSERDANAQEDAEVDQAPSA